MPTTNEITQIVNDPSLTDAEKAQLLEISEDEYRERLAAGYYAPLPEPVAEPAPQDERPAFEPGTDPLRQHQALQDAEAKKQAKTTGRTQDGRRTFSPEEQAAYNTYGGPVPVKNIWDWADKIESGVIKQDA